MSVDGCLDKQLFVKYDDKCDLLNVPHFCRWNLLWRLDSYFRVPFPWRQDNHLIQKLINTCDQIVTVPRFIGNVTEQLRGNKEINSKKNMEYMYECGLLGPESAGLLHHPP